MRELGDTDPPVTAVDLDWEVGNLTDSLGELYESWAFPGDEVPLPGLDGALRTIFEDRGERRTPSACPPPT